MPFFQQQPDVIEARQLTDDNSSEIMDWIVASSVDEYPLLMRSALLPLVIRTHEGDYEVTVGDWIIKGAKGEFKPCKSDIFETTYRPLIKQMEEQNES